MVIHEGALLHAVKLLQLIAEGDNYSVVGGDIVHRDKILDIYKTV